MVMKSTIRGRICPKGEDDAEHPSIIPMESTPMHQAPSGPMTRARARAIESEVNLLLPEIDMNMNGTWLLPHQNMLCFIRYEDELRQEVKEYPTA